ncbi:P-loop containing nucleoside triphosphate hydrolase protein [Testicularia cyperi]|uniref:P-loop containing nucleoside triphosphate hydrolase protein n=1 Tax=Testicularia cyperi TaxID=1882483 RepID=A0A317XIG0_9BASI|nr:P-loop containing nucleoside triphosphate hydrolase protein [Testicularia cyperi]
MVEADISPFLATIPPSVLATAKALKTYPKIETVLKAFVSSSRDSEANTTLEKKLRPLLTDAGVGKKQVAEIVEACMAVSVLAPTEQEPKAAMPFQSTSPATQNGKPDASSARSDAGATTTDVASETTDQVASTSTAATSAASLDKRADKKAKKASRIATKKSAASSDDELASAVNADLYLNNPDPKVRMIQALSQESRFHLDTTDNESLEIDLKTVSLTLAGQDLLIDSHLRLKTGVHYGLVGRNGTGKSTLMTAIGEKLVPGLPRNMKILFVSQLTTARAAEDEADSSVLNVVVRSDAERSRAVDESTLLNQVLETQDEEKVRDAVLQLKFERATERLREARKIAVKWSGAKGAWARKDLISAEREYEAAEQQKKSPPAVTPDTNGQWSTEAAQLLLESQSHLEIVDANSTEARAQKILHGLGFSPERIAGPYSALSGGWRSRATLASALLQPAHILLLDEPVNYLDLPAVLFVQEFIKSIEHTVVVVSHDREFLDAVADELIILRKQSLTYFDGNLTTYERESRLKRNYALRQQELLDKKKAQVQKSIAEASKQAKKSGDDNKMRMVKSRQRKLDDRWGVEVNAKGHRFKLNRDMAGYYLGSRSGPEIEDLDSSIRFTFPDPEELRFPGSLAHMDKVSVRYPGAKKETIKDITLTIGPGERVGIVGPNGHGKTTLLNAMVGKLTPSSGSIERHSRATFGIYAQHTLEMLADEKVTALAHFLARFPDAGEAQARSFLGQLGLKGRTADTVLLTGLSGGQLVRLGLAEVMWTSPDLVILDEVTTHLDSDTIDALVEALRVYTGAIVLVSHDRYAVKRIIELAKDAVATDQDDEDDADPEDDVDPDLKTAAKEPGRTFLLKNGTIKLLAGGMDDYANEVVKQVASQL